MDKGFLSSEDESMMSEMNMIPLIDIMLVLLIVFIITAPVMHHAFKLELPKESSQPQQIEPEAIQIAVMEDGSYQWNKDLINGEELILRLKESAALDPQPMLHLSADKDARYENVIHVLGLAQKASLTKIGFVTVPSE